MTNLQETILQIHQLNSLKHSYTRTPATSSMIDLLPSKRCHFLNLPRQVRDRIYYFVVIDFYRDTRQEILRVYPLCYGLWHRTPLALPMVSKQIGSEFTDTLYSPEIIQGRYLDTSTEPSVWKPMSSLLVRSTLHRECRPGEEGDLFLGGFKWSGAEAMELADCSVKAALVKDPCGGPWCIAKPAFNGYLELVPLRFDNEFAGNCFVVTVIKEEILKYAEGGAE